MTAGSSVYVGTIRSGSVSEGGANVAVIGEADTRGEAVAEEPWKNVGRGPASDTGSVVGIGEDCSPGGLIGVALGGV